MSDATEVEFFVVQGVEGPCLVMANRRIAGPKAWGGGRVIFTFKAERQRLLDALAASCRSASETERDRLRPAHDAEIREQAKREQMEADCAAACDYCRNGLYFDGESHIDRIRVFDGTQEGHEEQEEINCKALVIRAAYAKAHPESGKKEAEHAE